MSGGEGSDERKREWEEAAEAVAYDSCTWPPPVVAVCGPGNSGKSAFSRFLLNTLLLRSVLKSEEAQLHFPNSQSSPRLISLCLAAEQLNVEIILV
jgi:hypothetical protein